MNNFIIIYGMLINLFYFIETLRMKLFGLSIELLIMFLIFTYEGIKNFEEKK